MRTHQILCGNYRCHHRAEGRLFRVASFETTNASERALAVRKDAKTDDDLIDGLDGVLDDGEVWLCPNCREEV